MHGRSVCRFLLVAGLLLLAACSSAPASEARPSTVPTPAPTPTASAVTAIVPSHPPVQASPAGSAGGSGAAGFQACPSGGPGSGEPPPQDNGPRGACEAARILLPPQGPPCQPAGGATYASSSNCPLYPDLARRLDQQPLAGAGGAANPICRCQNTWQAATYVVEGPLASDPTGYDVRVGLDFGAGTHLGFDVMVEGVQSGSLISDIQCAGGGVPTSITQQPSAANNYLRCG